MGYACPVCEAPQADGEHLANHLAITAMLGRDDHAAWLDDHAPDWEESGPEELAEQVVEAVPETEFPQVFEDTTPDRRHGHDHEGEQQLPFEQELARQTGGRGAGRGELTGDARDIMSEARDLTEQMLADDGAEDEEAEDADGAAADETEDADGETTDEARGTDADADEEATGGR